MVNVAVDLRHFPERQMYLNLSKFNKLFNIIHKPFITAAFQLVGVKIEARSLIYMRLIFFKTMIYKPVPLFQVSVENSVGLWANNVLINTFFTIYNFNESAITFWSGASWQFSLQIFKNQMAMSSFVSCTELAIRSGTFQLTEFLNKQKYFWNFSEGLTGMSNAHSCESSEKNDQKLRHFEWGWKQLVDWCPLLCFYSKGIWLPTD